MVAVSTGSAPDVVGVSVPPKAVTTSEIPAAAYSAFLAAFVVSSRLEKARTWSCGPSRVKKERLTTFHPCTKW